MTELELLDQKLLANGWTKSLISNKPGLDARYTYKSNGLHVKLDLRLKHQSLWLWYVDRNDRSCLGFPYENKLESILDTIIQKQSSLTTYMGDYFDFQKSCDVQIMCWEQFNDSYADFSEDAQAELISKGQNARDEVNSLDTGSLDVEVFPGEKVARLSDYVSIMKKMQGGDFNGALQPYGLDIMSWGQVATKWGMKMASDPVLTEKFTRLLTQ